MVSAQLNNIRYTQILHSKGHVFNSSPAQSSFNVICGRLVSPPLYLTTVFVGGTLLTVVLVGGILLTVVLVGGILLTVLAIVST